MEQFVKFCGSVEYCTRPILPWTEGTLFQEEEGQRQKKTNLVKELLKQEVETLRSKKFDFILKIKKYCRRNYYGKYVNMNQ